MSKLDDILSSHQSRSLNPESSRSEIDTEARQQIKDLMLEIIGDNAKGVELVDPIDYENDDYFDSGYNQALGELRQKVNEL